MSVTSTEYIMKLDALLFSRPAGRNILDYAAEEIERLREERSTQREAAQEWKRKWRARQDTIERLQAELDACGECMKRADAEIGALKALVNETIDRNSALADENGQLRAHQLPEEVVDIKVVIGLRAEIEKLQKKAGQRGARMQKLYEQLQQHKAWDYFLFYIPEAADWFDDDGVPK